MTPTGNLQDILELIRKSAVLVVGDIMLDRFVAGDVHRISPESPVPVLTIRDETFMLGGAGNVLSNLAGLEAKAHILAAVGNDRDADTVRALVRERGIDPDGLITAADRPTTVKTRFLASHQQLLRTDFEKTGRLPADAEAALIARAIAVMPQVQAVILSDYGKGVLTPKIIAAILKAAHKAGLKVLVDPKGSDYSLYKGADVVTPNRKELSEATNGAATASDDDIVAAAGTIIRHAGIASVVATRSQDGMTIVSKEGWGVAAPVHLRTEALEVFDVSGAGDTVIATIAAALAAGATLEDAARLANKAAGLVVAKVGTAPVRRDELLAALDGGRRETKLCTREDAAETVQRWKARGLRVGFTNGCFDILHPGHVTYLAAARAQCDRLIVGLNADVSVKRLKGPERPVNDELSRAAVLAGLAAIDMIVLFGADTAENDQPVKLLERLKPAFFFKGGDYTEDRLPEASVVRSYGGAVRIMNLCEGHSTTGTLKKMKGRSS